MVSPEARRVASLPRRSTCLRSWRRAAPARLRVVCFPWCGAGASVYRHLAERLPPDLEVLAVQLPAREDRYVETPLRRMEAVVAQVLGELASFGDAPLVLFGHSMGAVVAHEVAHALRARLGREPELLVVSGHGAPTQRRLDSALWHDASEEQLLRNLGTLGGTPQALLADPAMMRMLLPAVRADYEVLESHVCPPRAPLRCPVVACCGRQDTAVTAEGVTAWRELTRGPFVEHWFDGGHFHLRDDARPLAEALSRWMSDPALTGAGVAG